MLRRGFGSAEGEAANDEHEEADDAPKAASLSDRLAQRLSAHRTAALQIEVARHPHVALAALVHSMAQTVLQPDAYGDRKSVVGKECVSTCRSRWSPYH